MQLTMMYRWKKSNDRNDRGLVTTTIETILPSKMLKQIYPVDGGIMYAPAVATTHSDYAEQLLLQRIRTIRFMELTGARPTKKHVIPGQDQMGRYEQMLPGFDHTNRWVTPSGIPFLTTEPYNPDSDSSWAAYAFWRLPVRWAMWNPPSTTLFILTRLEYTEALIPIIERLEASAPPPAPLFVEKTMLMTRMDG